MKRKHDKLVRDGIPALIEARGALCATRVLGDEEYVQRLDAKLAEELNEYLADGSLEELADLVEVIRATALARGGSWDELESLRIAKRAERGGFDGRVLLIEVDDA